MPADFRMGGSTMGPLLSHVPQDRHPPALQRQITQSLQCGNHGIRIGVVRVIQDPYPIGFPELHAHLWRGTISQTTRYISIFQTKFCPCGNRQHRIRHLVAAQQIQAIFPFKISSRRGYLEGGTAFIEANLDRAPVVLLPPDPPG